MGNVKVDYDFQLEKTKKEMNCNGSSHIRTSYIHRHSVSSLKDSSVRLKMSVELIAVTRVLKARSAERRKIACGERV